MAWYERSTILIIRGWAGEDDAPSDLPAAEAVHLKGWQVAPAKEFDRIASELLALRAWHAEEPWQQARHALIRADTALHGKGNWISNWWSGARIETAWAAIHEAEAWLLLLLPDDNLQAMLPSLRASVEHRLGSKDSRREPYLAQIKAMTPPATHVDPHYLKQIDEDVRVIADVAHTKLRTFRNRVFTVGAILVFAAVLRTPTVRGPSYWTARSPRTTRRPARAPNPRTTERPRPRTERQIKQDGCFAYPAVSRVRDGRWGRGRGWQSPQLRASSI